MTGPLGFSFRRTFRHTLSACKAVPSCSCVMRSSTLHRRSSILHPRAYLVGGGGGGGWGGATTSWCTTRTSSFRAAVSSTRSLARRQADAPGVQ